MTKPPTTLVLRVVFVEGFREFLRFPFWWYTQGLKQTLERFLSSIRISVVFFGIDVWGKNLFVPMYGDTSLMGRLISFLVRAVVLAVRSVGVGLWIIVIVLLSVCYLAILPIAFIGFFFHLISVIF